MKHIKYVKKIPYILVLIGALNWGMYGIVGFDVVDMVIGGIPMIARIIYVLIGLSALYGVINTCAFCRCKQCPCAIASTKSDIHTCSIEDKK
jgi:uncharacterized membrane protein YuzA (DUF378 family)